MNVLNGHYTSADEVSEWHKQHMNNPECVCWMAKTAQDDLSG